jgi:tripartite-type tricarboxylate transporter receptor subunit TctC
MNLPFRLALYALVVAAATAPAFAQSWPTRPVTVVVPFAAGSSTDTAARILAVGMSEVLGQQLIIENVGGAAGMTGTLRVARAAPDGYQLLFGTVDTLAIAPALQKQPLYDTIKDFAPAGMVVEQPIILIVREDLPAKTMAEFATYAKTNQAKMQFGSAGVGSGSHFACAKLNAALGIDTVHVPYRSSGLAAQDLIGGRLDYLCGLGATARQPIESGKAKAIALLTADRSPLFPQLTTSKEQGVAGGRHRPAACRCQQPDAQPPRDGGAIAPGRHRAGRRGSPVAGLSARLHGDGNENLGRPGEGERAAAAISGVHQPSTCVIRKAYSSAVSSSET